MPPEKPRPTRGAPPAPRLILPYTWKVLPRPSLSGSEASRGCSDHRDWPSCHRDPDRNPGMRQHAQVFRTAG